MNPDYENIAKKFVTQYYQMFDGDAAARTNIANFYDDNASLLTFEGAPFMGKLKIAEKLGSLTFQKVAHAISTLDSQPTIDGGIVIMVLGQLKTDDDPPHNFIQTFVLKPLPTGSYFVQHDLFRLVLNP